jgi:protoporphyrinogen oxidase
MSKILIIGAGPGGLTAAYALRGSGHDVVVLEKDPEDVGGLSRTVQYKGYRFDIGGHRFYSKSSEIEELWTTWLGSEMLVRRRLSRIYYNHRFFAYPIRPLNVLQNLGIPYTSLCVLSYLKAKLLPRPEVKSFEDWVINQFGERLYTTFFKTYTEKVWGIPCHQISADWAAQRIKGLSMFSLIRSILQPRTRQRDRVIKTLIDQFRYPRLGPGQMWEEVRTQLETSGQRVLLDHGVTRLHWRPGQGVQTVEACTCAGERSEFPVHQVISTMPLRSLVNALDPLPPDSVLQAAAQLKYRDFLTIALILDQPQLFPDNWIYVHDPSVQVGRIQNFKNWSPDLVPDPQTTCLGLEYFCTADQQLWDMRDPDLIALATRELTQLGLCGHPDQPAQVLDGAVVRVPKAYPVYDHEYLHHIAVIREFVEQKLPNLQLVGRNGMHRYNNQDHAMMTGLLAARNILTGSPSFDLWRVNQDATYLEEGPMDEQEGGRLVPRPLQPEVAAKSFPVN